MKITISYVERRKESSTLNTLIDRFRMLMPKRRGKAPVNIDVSGISEKNEADYIQDDLTILQTKEMEEKRKWRQMD